MVLRAILRVETRMKPNTVAKNENGTVDVGIAGINTIHFAELAKWNIAPADLLDACIGTYVGAWHLARTLGKRPETWEAIARYHSATPYYNQRYQIMLWNELVKLRVVAGELLPVPPLRPERTQNRVGRGSKPAAASSGTGVVFDDAVPN